MFLLYTGDLGTHSVIYLLTSCVIVTVYQVWQCGGYLLISTCSHVGHVFRRFAPYSFRGGIVGGLRILQRNMERLVNVWLDVSHRAIFYLSSGKQERGRGYWRKWCMWRWTGIGLGLCELIRPMHGCSSQLVMYVTIGIAIGTGLVN